MRKDTIGQSDRTTVKISDSLQSSVLHSIRNVVPDELIERAPARRSVTASANARSRQWLRCCT